MMARHYPALFEGDAFHAEALAFAGRVIELTRFLADVLDAQLIDRGGTTRVAWHSSCHALREAAVDAQPRRLLGQLANVEIVPLPRERECCGFGGTFSVRHPEISAAMVEDKADAVVSTGAAALLSGDGGCLLNISGRLDARGAGVRACHVAEFLWERTRER
jgi:L-lactate dehydrogenase complex protein LldE